MEIRTESLDLIHMSSAQVRKGGSGGVGMGPVTILFNIGRSFNITFCQHSWIG